MRIAFLLPGEGTFPGGGAKVVYEYANALVRRSHQVTVVHPAFFSPKMTADYMGRRAIRYVQRSIGKSYRPDSWMTMDPRVQLHWKPSLHPRYIPDGDVVVATSWLTAERVAGFPQSKGEKFYLIQHQETWSGPTNRVMNTWRLPLEKIVISRWLQEIAGQMKEIATYIPNGLDFDAFGLDVAPQDRRPSRAMMPYHHAEWKGSADGLTALHLARERVPTMEVDMFGVGPPPGDLPPWIRYYRNPPQGALRELYNRAAIFVAPSWSEGWGLPASEAMQCGCAVVATDIGGHREFCLPDRTALLSPPKDPQAMAHNIVSLSEDQEKRLQIARTGHQRIQEFTWERATNRLENAFDKRLKPEPIHEPHEG